MPDLASNPVSLVFCVSAHDCGTAVIVPLLYEICNNDGYDTGVCEPSTVRFGKFFLPHCQILTQRQLISGFTEVGWERSIGYILN